MPLKSDHLEGTDPDVAGRGIIDEGRRRKLMLMHILLLTTLLTLIQGDFPGYEILLFIIFLWKFLKHFWVI